MNDKKTIRPEAQAFSDVMMMTRYAALYLKHCALNAQTNLLELQNAIMADPDSKMMAMDTGQIEQMLLELSSQHGKAKHIHKLANDIGRKLNEPMPETPAYSEEYLALAARVIPVKLSSVARR